MRSQTVLKVVIALAAALAAVTAPGCSAPAPREQATTVQVVPSCSQHTMTVSLSPTSPGTYIVSGWLCEPQPSRVDRAGMVELLVSGLTYDHTYWDPSYHPDAYSYVRAAARAGYPTFAIDRLGVGDSGRPPADQLTLQAHAHVVAQIVYALRDGTATGHRYTTVVGVGHSLGAGILQYLAGTNTDRTRIPDRLVLMDYLSKTNPAVVAQIGETLHPAADDARFAGQSIPDGYLTTRPGARIVFYTASDVDPGMLTEDELGKATTTLAERSTASAARDRNVTRAVTVPVLLVVGATDSLACAPDQGLSCANPAAVLMREADTFSSTACVGAVVVAAAGHVLNLHRGARAGFDRIHTWLSNGPSCPSPTPTSQRRNRGD